MDENTIFQSPQILQKPLDPSQTQTAPVAQPQSGSKPLSILKLLLGIMVFIAIGFIVVSLIAPHLGKKSSLATLSYWGLFDEPYVLKPLISDFEKEYPNIKVEYVKQDIKEYRERLTARIQNGTGPDIFVFHNTWVPMFSSILLPIPVDTITKSDFEKSFYPVAGGDLIKNGAIYGIPSGIDTLSLFINKQLFDAAGISVPTNWEDFINASRQLTVKDQDNKIKTAGAAMGTFANINHAPDIISMLFAQNGVDLKDLGSKPDRVAEALTFYTSFAKISANVWDSSLDPSLLAFAKENLAMYFGYAKDIAEIKAINPAINFEVYPIPHLPSQDITIASYFADGVSVKSKNQKEALLFLKFITKHNTLQRIFEATSKTKITGSPYPNISFANLLKDNKIVYPFVSQASGAVSSYFVDGTYDNGLNTKMNSYLESAVSSILNDNISSENAANSLSEGVKQVLQEYSIK